MSTTNLGAILSLTRSTFHELNPHNPGGGWGPRYDIIVKGNLTLVVIGGGTYNKALQFIYNPSPNESLSATDNPGNPGYHAGIFLTESGGPKATIYYTNTKLANADPPHPQGIVIIPLSDFPTESVGNGQYYYDPTQSAKYAFTFSLSNPIQIIDNWS